MIKQRKKQFQILIRRQQKDKLFTKLRKQNQQTILIQKIINQLLKVEILKLNFAVLNQLFHQLNQKLIQLSKDGSKSYIHNFEGEENTQTFLQNILQNRSRPFAKLISANFKNYTLRTFQFTQKQKKNQKLNRNQFELAQLLNFQLLFMNGLLLKQAVILINYFPFQSIQKKSPMNTMLTQEREECFQGSFDLLERNIFHLTRNFNQLALEEDKLVLFLNLLNSIIKVIQFFMINNSYNYPSTLQLSKSQSKDSQLINYFYEVLRSHNFENYLQNLMENIVTQELNRQDHQQPGPQIDISIILSLLSITQRYLKLIQFLDIPNISSNFVNQVKKFAQFSLQYLGNWKRVRQGKFYSQCETQKTQHIKCNIQELISRVQLRVLFQLSNLHCHQPISFKKVQIAQLSIKTIHFLIEKSFSTGHNQSNGKYWTMTSQFYFQVLIAEQDDKWMHYLELLGPLQYVMSNLSLDELLSCAIKNDLQFDFSVVLKFVQRTIFSIINQTGCFYRERCLFVEKLLEIFSHWILSFQNNKDSLIDPDKMLVMLQQMERSINQLSQSTQILGFSSQNQDLCPNLFQVNNQYQKGWLQSSITHLQQIIMQMKQQLRQTNQVQI